MLLSVCMMVKNEEKNLEACLEALQPILENLDSELIIIDTGSTDRTIEIAKKYTSNLYFHEWDNDFSGMRNKTISYAKGKWVFIIDGDEILQDAKPIINFLKSKEEQRYNTATVKIKNWTDEKNDNYAMGTAHRLFIRKGFSYRGKVHNQPVFKSPLKHLDTIMDHYGYIATDEELMEKKFQRTAGILKSELERDPENIYYLYQLAESYGMHKEDGLALEAAMKAYNLLNKKKLNKVKYLYVVIATAKYNIRNDKLAEAEMMLREVLPEAEEYIDVQYYMSTSLYLQNKKEEAIWYVKKYLDLIDRFDQLESSKNLSVKNESSSQKSDLIKMLGKIYYEMEKFEDALTYLVKYEENTNLGDVMGSIINAFFKTKDYQGIHDYYQKVKSSAQNEIVAQVFEVIESILKNSSDEEIKEICYQFKDEEGNYGVLSQVRISLMDEVEEESLLNKVTSSDFKSFPPYYSDIVLYLLEKKEDLAPFVRDIFEEGLNKILAHMFSRLNRMGKDRTKMDLKSSSVLEDKIQNLGELVLEYIEYFETNKKVEEMDDKIEYYRLFKVLSKYPLVSLKIDDALYKQIFDKYIYYGQKYIQEIYTAHVLENEQVFHMKGQEDAFLLYMFKGLKIKDNDKRAYIKYLRKALNMFGLTKGIEIMMEEIEKEETLENEEMKNLKIQFKKNIQILIDTEKIAEAEELIKEYEKIVTEDVELLLFKSKISIMKLEQGEYAKV